MVIIKRLQSILKDSQGISYPLVSAIVLSLMMLFMVGYEFMRLQIIASGIRDAMQSAVISVANQNAEDVYDGLIKGYTGGYERDEGAFIPRLTTGNIYAELDGLLGTQQSGERHTKLNVDGGIEYEIYGLTVDVHNAPQADRDGRTFEVGAKISLEVPIYFMGKALPPMHIDSLRVTSKYITKF